MRHGLLWVSLRNHFLWPAEDVVSLFSGENENDFFFNLTEKINTLLIPMSIMRRKIILHPLSRSAPHFQLLHVLYHQA